MTVSAPSPPASLFDPPVEELLRRWHLCGASRNLARSLRAAYRLEGEPWIGGVLRAAATEFALALPPVLKRSEAEDGTTKLLIAFGATVGAGTDRSQEGSGRRSRRRLRPESPLSRSDEVGTRPGFVPGTRPRLDAVECVLIPAIRGDYARDRMSARNRTDGKPRPDRRSIAAGCISTQVGCAAGCAFCASGMNGLTRHLSVGEIVVQALLLRREAESRGMRLATLVFMGMGEPLHNTANVVGAIANLTHVAGGAFAPRGITVSTVGVLAGMKELAASQPAPHLAVSLHAPDDETRARIVPSGRRPTPHLVPRGAGGDARPTGLGRDARPTGRGGLASVAETLDAASAYRAQSGRDVTISYVLLDGVNDRPEQANLLARLLDGRGFHVNLIPFNDVEGLPFRATPPERAQEFWNILRGHRLSVHFRRARGAGEDAACGQLRRRAQAV